MSRTRTAALAVALALAVGTGATAPGPVAAQPASAAPDAVGSQPGAELRVWLVTAAPGDVVWERFGHNAIRILDTASGQDVSYNWGIFDFAQPGFVPRFLKGQMLYMMAGFWTDPMVASYTDVGRDVVLQELNLTPAQRAELRGFLEWNSLPENRDYRYDYFRDNCSTRVRDALDRVLDGELSRRFAAAPTGTSYRWHIRRLTRMDPFLYTGMDVLLGSPGDVPITLWEEMFLPMTLRDAVRGVTLTGADGTERPLVLDEARVGPGTRPEDPTTPPGWLAWYLVLGVALGGVLAWSGSLAAGGAGWARWTLAVLGGGWSLLTGLLGTLLVLVLFTDHAFMTWNLNILLASPLSLALVILVPRAARRGGLAGPHGPGGGALRAAERTSMTVAALCLVAVAAWLVPATTQDNAIFLAMATPVHLGLWWGLRTMARKAGPL